METTSTHQGNFRLALEHFDNVLSLYDPDQERDDLLVRALNPGVAVRCFAGWCLWFIGQPDRSLVRVQEAVAIARQISEPHGLVHALVFAAVLHQLRRERPLAQQHADAAMALADEHGLAFYGAMARIVRGWALIRPGNDAQAAEEIRQGMADWERTGAQLLRPYYLALLAESLAPAEHAPALRLLDESLTLARSTGEHMYEAEICRLRGERLLIGPPGDANMQAAEACFEEALAIARQQGALSLELRAAMSLARLDLGHRRKMPARDLVASIYQRFEDGLDTLDLRDARAFLPGDSIS
jgi:predicted ATPase